MRDRYYESMGMRRQGDLNQLSIPNTPAPALPAFSSRAALNQSKGLDYNIQQENSSLNNENNNNISVQNQLKDPFGVQIVAGPPGQAGPPGAPGRDGRDGDQGPPGLSGSNAADGPPGRDGAAPPKTSRPPKSMNLDQFGKKSNCDDGSTTAGSSSSIAPTFATQLANAEREETRRQQAHLEAEVAFQKLQIEQLRRAQAAAQAHIDNLARQPRVLEREIIHHIAPPPVQVPIPATQTVAEHMAELNHYLVVNH